MASLVSWEGTQNVTGRDSPGFLAVDRRHEPGRLATTRLHALAHAAKVGIVKGIALHARSGSRAAQLLKSLKATCKSGQP